MGLLTGKFRQCLTEFYAHDTIMAGYYSLTFLLATTVFYYLLDFHQSTYRYYGTQLNHHHFEAISMNTHKVNFVAKVAVTKNV